MYALNNPYHHGIDSISFICFSDWMTYLQTLQNLFDFCDGLSVLSPGIWASLSVPLSWKIASSLDPSFANIFRQDWAPSTQNHIQPPTLTLSGHYTTDVHPLQLLQHDLHYDLLYSRPNSVLRNEKSAIIYSLQKKIFVLPLVMRRLIHDSDLFSDYFFLLHIYPSRWRQM